MVERLVRRRRTILWGSFIGYGLFYGGILLTEGFAPGSTGAVIVSAIALGGWVVWVVSIVRVRLLGRGVPLQARRALVDELWRANVMRSMAFAFWAMLALQVIAVLTRPQRAPELTIYVGVMTALGAFLYLDRE